MNRATGDSVTKTTTESYASQVIQSLVVAGFGLVFVAGSLTLVWFNEARQYTQTISLRNAEMQLITVQVYDRENDGKVVYVSGPLASQEVVRDERIAFERGDAPPAYDEANSPQTPSSAHNFLELTRNVEMLQWEERQESNVVNEFGGRRRTTTLYTYHMAWRAWQIRSENFQQGAGHHNPEMTISSQVFRPSVLHLGNFLVPPEVADRLSPQPLFPSAVIWNRNRVESTGGQWYMIRSHGEDEKVGDLRVSFTCVEGPQVVSLIGRQQGMRLEPLDGLGSLLVGAGEVPPQRLLEAGHATNSSVSSLLRCAGGFLCVLGFRFMFEPIVTGVVVVPFVSDVVGAAAWTIAMPLGLTSVALTIPFAKLRCRVPRLRAVVLLAYLGCLVASFGALSAGVAWVGRGLQRGAQSQMNNLGSSVGEAMGAFDAARKRHL